MRCRSLNFALFLVLALSAPAAWAGQPKVQVCHVPPGNPSNFHTITISQNALQAHLGHGDFAGACFEHCSQLCDDGNACTVDSCNPATGCSSAPRVCSDGNLCTVDSCDPLTGDCVFPPAVCPQGQTCNLGNGNCEVNDIDECLSDPCLNGDCIDRQNGYVCACQPGWTGRLCEVDIDECQSDPCLNGAVCNDQVNGFTCTCPPGFTGASCEIAIDECESNPCVNGACIDRQNSYVCACQPGWTGRLCDVDIDECQSSPCVNGDCYNGQDRFDCLCPPGFSGTFCEIQDGGCIVDNILCFGTGEKKK